MNEVKSKRAELEAYFKKYSDVPREVIIKEDLSRLGIWFTEAALKATEGCRTKAYAGGIFSWDAVSNEQVDKTIFSRVPEQLHLKGGPYGLRGRVRVLTRLNNHSPYMVDVFHGECRVCVREEGRLVPVADLHSFRPRPKYWDKYFEDGTPYRSVAKADAHVLAFVMCQHWGPKEECMYCDINENWKMTHERGQTTQKLPYSDPRQVAEVIAEIFREEREPVDRPLGVFIDGGAITTKVAGLPEDDFYLRYVNLIREKIGTRWPIHIATAPKPKNLAKRMRDEGVTGHNTNFEVWDKRLFEIMCPGKSRAIGWDNWITMTIEEVDIFGEGNVTPGFVAGLELAQPWGFKDISEAVKSTTSGLEFLMSHGVVPRPITWIVEPRSKLAGQTPPSLDYLIQIDVAWYELMLKYRLPPYAQGIHARRMGPGVWEYPGNAAGDMGP